jgi:hypothetical protein
MNKSPSTLEPQLRGKSTPPQTPILGKPVTKAILTPDQRDRVIVVRRDLRAGEYQEPKQGDPFKGVDQKETATGYIFATKQYVDPPGTFVDEYYLKTREDQERYNFQIEYPYVAQGWPRITRTYVCLRTDFLVVQEPDADAVDPSSDDLRLTDHKIDRASDDPVVDSLFVKVIRTFERLPSPVITTFKENQYQQEVTTKTQEVVASDPPNLSAVVEEGTQERTGTAKAKNVSSTVPRVFPATGLSAQIPSMTRELWLGGFTETMESEVTAGQAFPPSLSAGIYQVDEKQLTEFKVETTIHALPLPQTRQHQEMTEAFGGGILTEILQIDTPASGLTADEGYLITESRMRNLDAFGRIKMTKALSDASQWPVLHEEKVIDEGIYAGIKIIIDKQVVPAGLKPDGSGPPYTPNPGGFTDMIPHDKWRTLQVTSRVDLTSLPKPITYVATHPLHLPNTLLSVSGVYGDKGGKTQEVLNDGKSGERVSVSVDSGPLGTIAHTIQDGFHGDALALITRIFTTSPPQQLINGAVIINGLSYKPTKFLPVVGTASMFSTQSKFTAAFGDGISASGNEGEVRAQRVEIGPVLTGQFLASGPTNTSFQGASNSAGATTSDGLFHIEMFQPGNKATMTVTMPMSSPAVIPASGASILVAVEVQEWRFGIWVIHLINAIIP